MKLDDIINDWIKGTNMTTYNDLDEFINDEDDCEESTGYGFDSEYVHEDVAGTFMYSFRLEDAEGRVVVHDYRMPWDSTYDAVLDQFAKFISSVYGYKINITGSSR